MEGVLPEHRRLFLNSLDVFTDDLYLLTQVHGERVYVLENPEVDCSQVSEIEADAIVTRLTHKPIGVMTADCIPGIVYDPEVHAVGLVHSGRQGTWKRVLSRTIATMIQAFGCSPERMILGLGPGIGGCCYEVEESCIPPFQKEYGDWETFVERLPSEKVLLDLFAANEADARGAGILPKNIYRLNECTSCNNDRWFSYRREGLTGRIISMVMLRE